MSSGLPTRRPGGWNRRVIRLSETFTFVGWTIGRTVPYSSGTPGLGGAGSFEAAYRHSTPPPPHVVDRLTGFGGPLPRLVSPVTMRLHQSLSTAGYTIRLGLPCPAQVARSVTHALIYNGTHSNGTCACWLAGKAACFYYRPARSWVPLPCANFSADAILLYMASYSSVF